MTKEKRTYADRREYFIMAITRRRRRIKDKAIALKVGQCQLCGYNRYQGASDFHHVDPAIKSFGIGGKGHSRAWSRVEEELAKCLLVCANCHREITAGLVDITAVFTQQSV